ncbi:MAG TPA: SMC-Scp complex subunit ScpB [Candidatus Korarchaeota archaeon]|nr:SMC-Scp complex subunit ScpB [Candidatus Korarchaeota archaeon]
MNYEEAEKLVEAALFIAGRPLSNEEISKLTGMEEKDIEKIVEKLNQKYRNRTFHIVKSWNGWEMRLKPEYEAKVGKVALKVELTIGELRTLAAIIELQPVTLSYLAKIRGSRAYLDVKKFKRMGLVRTIKGEGRSPIVKTTKIVKSYFNIEERQTKHETRGRT